MTTITAQHTCGHTRNVMYARKPTKREMDADRRRMETTPYPRCEETDKEMEVLGMAALGLAKRDIARGNWQL